MAINSKIIIIVLVMVAVAGATYFLGAQKNNLGPTVKVNTPVPTQTQDPTVNWQTYANKTYGYSIKFPATFNVPPQTEREKSQLGVDNNISVERNSDPSGSGVIVIDVNTVTDVNFYNGMSLEDYLSKNLKLYGIDGPLISYNFNGYDSLINKNQPGTNVFVKQGQNVYHITAATASSDKEIEDIVATFKFTQ